MITDHQTNTVYLADSCLDMEEKKEFRKFKSFLEKHKMNVKILKGTEDFYCRDFMPIQLSEKEYVQFIFRPERYLKENELEFISSPQRVGLENNLVQPKYSNIILDGGNVVKWEDKVIITDRVIKDNLYQFSDSETILKQLEKELRCKVIIIPEYPGDATGHADGLIRFMDKDTVFINDAYSVPEKEWLNEFLNILSENKLIHINLPCTLEEGDETAEGLYINYLHVGNLIVVPQFGQDEDQVALEIMTRAFGGKCNVLPYPANWIAEYGGVFNCATWTVLE